MGDIRRDYPKRLKAGVPTKIGAPGNWWQLIKTDLPIEIRFDENRPVIREQGMGGAQNYTEVTLLSLVDQDIVISLGFGEESDQRVAVTGTIDAEFPSPNLIVPLPSVTLAPGQRLILANSSSQRKELRISLSSENDDGIFIGDLTVDENLGGFIEPGVTEYLTNTASVYGYNASSTSVTVNLLSVELFT